MSKTRQTVCQPDDSGEQKQWQIRLIACSLMKWWEWHLTSILLLPKTNNPSLTVKKTSDKSQMEDILQNSWPVLLKKSKSKSSKIMKVWETVKDKRSLRRHDNKIWYGFFDGIQEEKKGIRQQTMKCEYHMVHTLTKLYFYLVCQYLFINSDKCTILM